MCFGAHAEKFFRFSFAFCGFSGISSDEYLYKYLYFYKYELTFLK